MALMKCDMLFAVPSTENEELQVLTHKPGLSIASTKEIPTIGLMGLCDDTTLQLQKFVIGSALQHSASSVSLDPY